MINKTARNYGIAFASIASIGVISGNDAMVKQLVSSPVSTQNAAIKSNTNSISQQATNYNSANSSSSTANNSNSNSSAKTSTQSSSSATTSSTKTSSSNATSATYVGDAVDTQ